MAAYRKIRACLTTTQQLTVKRELSSLHYYLYIFIFYWIVKVRSIALLSTIVFRVMKLPDIYISLIFFKFICMHVTTTKHKIQSVTCVCVYVWVGVRVCVCVDIK